LAATVIAKPLLAAFGTRVLKKARDFLLRSPAERAVKGAVYAALLRTIESQAPEATSKQRLRVAMVLDRCWPVFDFSLDGTGSLLDSLEFMVTRAMTLATAPVELGDEYLPTSSLDAIRDETGVHLEAVSFAQAFSEHFVDTLGRVAATEQSVAALAHQLSQDRNYRILRSSGVIPALFGVEFVAHRNSRLSSGQLMDDLLIAFINRGNAVASQVSFKFIADAAYMDGVFVDDDSAVHGIATQVLPGDDTTFRSVNELGHRSDSFRFALYLALVRGSDGELLSPRPLTVQITPTFLDGVSTTPRTGPTARAHLTWARGLNRFALTYGTQVLDPLGPAV
jgi:hypothetical protein